MNVRRWLALIAVAALAAAVVAGCKANTGSTGTGNEKTKPSIDTTALIEAWSESTHSVPVASIATRSPCAGCHDGLAFSRGVNDPAQLKDKQPFGPYVVATDCRACHTGRGAEILKSGTADNVPSASGPVTGGLGALCMSCHNQEAKADINDPAHGYPHYGPQADVLNGTGGITDGLTLMSTDRHRTIANTCVACHVGNDIAKGHTFAPTEDQCPKCHTDFKGVDSVMATADYDGNGKTEAFVTEVAGLMAAVQQATNKKAGSDKFVTSRGDIFFISKDTTMTAAIPKEAYQGAYNWVLIDHDKSQGIHNPFFTVSLLQETYRVVAGSALPNAVAPKSTGQ